MKTTRSKSNQLDGIRVSKEKLAYAALLSIGTIVSLILLPVCFVIYLTGLLEPHVALAELPSYWSLPLRDYLEQTNYDAGWSWLGMLNKGDFLNFIPIALLSGLTIFCYIRIIPIFIKDKHTPYVVISVLEILILLLAASGVLTAGH